jgi:hypothetical protein
MEHTDFHMRNATLLLAILFGLTFPLQPASASRDNPYRKIQDRLEQLNDDFSSVLRKRERYGADDRMSARLASIDRSLRWVRAELRSSEPNVERMYQETDRIRSLIDRADYEYRSFGRSAAEPQPRRHRFFFGY